MPDLRADIPVNELMPGSLLAAARGCTCSAKQPEDPTEELLDIDCPLHGILSDEGPPLPETA